MPTERRFRTKNDPIFTDKFPPPYPQSSYTPGGFDRPRWPGGGPGTHREMSDLEILDAAKAEHIRKGIIAHSIIQQGNSKYSGNFQKVIEKKKTEGKTLSGRNVIVGSTYIYATPSEIEEVRKGQRSCDEIAFSRGLAEIKHGGYYYIGEYKEFVAYIPYEYREKYIEEYEHINEKMDEKEKKRRQIKGNIATLKNTSDVSLTSYEIQRFAEEYSKLVLFEPNYEHYGSKAYYLALLERYDEALESYDNAIELAGSWSYRIENTYVYKVEILLKLNKLSDIIRECDKGMGEIEKINGASRSSSNGIEKSKLLNSKIKALIKLNRFSEVIKECDKGIDEVEIGTYYHTELIRYRAYALENLLGERFDFFCYVTDKYEKLRCYTEPLELNPKDYYAWNELGLALEKNGESSKEAIKCYDRSLKLKPYSTVWYNKARMLNDLGKYEEAIGCYDKALELDLKFDKAWHCKGYTLDTIGKYEEAIRCHDKALELNPKNDMTWNNKGFALDNLGKYKEAIKCYDKALEINPNNSTALNNKEIALKSSKEKNKIKIFGFSINFP